MRNDKDLKKLKDQKKKIINSFNRYMTDNWYKLETITSISTYFYICKNARYKNFFDQLNEIILFWCKYNKSWKKDTSPGEIDKYFLFKFQEKSNLENHEDYLDFYTHVFRLLSQVNNEFEVIKSYFKFLSSHDFASDIHKKLPDDGDQKTIFDINAIKKMTISAPLDCKTIQFFLKNFWSNAAIVDQTSEDFVNLSFSLLLQELILLINWTGISFFQTDDYENYNSTLFKLFDRFTTKIPSNSGWMVLFKQLYKFYFPGRSSQMQIDVKNFVKPEGFLDQCADLYEEVLSNFFSFKKFSWDVSNTVDQTLVKLLNYDYSSFAQIIDPCAYYGNKLIALIDDCKKNDRSYLHDEEDKYFFTETYFTKELLYFAEEHVTFGQSIIFYVFLKNHGNILNLSNFKSINYNFSSNTQNDGEQGLLKEMKASNTRGSTTGDDGLFKYVITTFYKNYKNDEFLSNIIDSTGPARKNYEERFLKQILLNHDKILHPAGRAVITTVYGKKDVKPNYRSLWRDYNNTTSGIAYYNGILKNTLMWVDWKNAASWRAFVFDQRVQNNCVANHYLIKLDFNEDALQKNKIKIN